MPISEEHQQVSISHRTFEREKNEKECALKDSIHQAAGRSEKEKRIYFPTSSRPTTNLTHIATFRTLFSSDAPIHQLPPFDAFIPILNKMKLSFPLIIAAIAAPGASAFAPGSIRRSAAASSVILQNSRVDTSDAIAEAMKISKKYGPTSKEAALAWEAVEEMDASDNS